MEELLNRLIYQLKGMWKYHWYGVSVIWLVAVGGWLSVYTLPDDYESSARIYVDTQSVLQPLMAGMAITPDMEQLVSIMSRTLISRPNVERIMRMVDLDIQAKTAKDREQLINELMSDIKITSTGQGNLYSISYGNEDPKIAKAVVQSLLTIFVEGGLTNKKQDSTSAISFINEQIKDYQAKLVSTETALKEFKQKNMGLLPGQGTDYLTKLSSASDQLNQAKLELREAEESRDALKSQVSDNEPDSEVNATPVTDSDTNSNPEIDDRIQALEKTLDALRLRYTEQHPDIITTKRLIAALEERKKAEAKQNKHSNPGDPGKNYSPMLQQLNVALAQADANTAAVKARVEEYSARYNRLRSMSNAVPEVEAELARLTRDYELNKANYDKLVERRDSAQMSGEMNSTTDLLSFKIIDPPTTPQFPTGPDWARLFSLVLFGAVASGIGIAFLISQLRPTFQDQNSLRELTGRPILGSVSMIWTNQEKIKHRREIYAISISFLFLFGLYGMLMVKAIARIPPS